MKFLFITLSLSLPLSLFSQYNDTIVLKQNEIIAKKATWNCLLGDTTKMELSFNSKYYKFRSGLPDGLHVAFFDEDFQDTAIICVFENGEINGLRIRCEDGRIKDAFEYRNGLKNGWGKQYLYIEGHGRFINVLYCEDDVCTEIYTEF